MKLRTTEEQSDGLNLEKQVSCANTRSSRENFEIRVEFHKLFNTEVVVNSVAEHASKHVSVEDIIGSTGKNESMVDWEVVKQIICIIFGSIGIVLIVTGSFMFMGLSPFHENKKCNDGSKKIQMQKTGTIVYNHDSSYKSVPQSSCKADEYQIKVQMSNKLFSGTDDKVEIRLYGQNGEMTEWFELMEPSHGKNGLERLSTDVYCVNFRKRPETIGRLEKIGIQKFGSDRMMIDEILIQSNYRNMFFPVGQWIRTHAEEHLFELDYEF